MNWFIRMARWARHPPSPGRVKLVFGVVAACVILVGIEKFWGWPNWLTVNRVSPGKVQILN